MRGRATSPRAEDGRNHFRPRAGVRTAPGGTGDAGPASRRGGPRGRKGGGDVAGCGRGQRAVGRARAGAARQAAFAG